MVRLESVLNWFFWNSLFSLSNFGLSFMDLHSQLSSLNFSILNQLSLKSSKDFDIPLNLLITHTNQQYPPPLKKTNNKHWKPFNSLSNTKRKFWRKINSNQINQCLKRTFPGFSVIIWIFWGRSMETIKIENTIWNFCCWFLDQRKFL